MKRMPCLLLFLTLGLGACDTGHEPNGCGSDLYIAVDGGATVRFEWDSGCAGGGVTEPYRDRPLTTKGP